MLQKKNSIFILRIRVRVKVTGFRKNVVSENGGRRFWQKACTHAHNFIHSTTKNGPNSRSSTPLRGQSAS